MADVHLAKRRRLTIHKPFRSPIKVDTVKSRNDTHSAGPLVSKVSAESKPPGRPPVAPRPSPLRIDTADHEGDSKLARIARDEIPDSEGSDAASPLATSPTAYVAPAATPTSTAASTFAPASKPTTTATAAPPALQRQLRLLQEQIDILSFPSSASTAASSRLPSLIALWTRAAREAADTLYPGIKARVEASASASSYSGGRTGATTSRGAMAEQQREDAADKAEAQLVDMQARLERGEGANGEEIGAVERRVGLDEVAARRWALKQEAAGRIDGRAEGEEEEEDDQGFTMGTMLRGMNIEWELLGWDEERMEWKDDGL